jgi:P2-related tail formation protein
MRVYNGTAWIDAGSAVNGTSERNVYTATGGQTTFAVTYDIGFVDVYLNGVKLTINTDFTATSGTNIVLAVGATGGDIVDIVAYGAFNIANTYTQTQADARYALADDALALAIALG